MEALAGALSQLKLELPALVDSRGKSERILNAPADAGRAEEIRRYFDTLKDELTSWDKQEEGWLVDFHDIIIKGLVAIHDDPSKKADIKTKSKEILASFYVYKEIAKRVQKIIIN
jgi:hypothetical protein